MRVVAFQKNNRFILLCISLLLCPSVAAQESNSRAANEEPVGSVIGPLKNLHYGNVLFKYYQGKSYGAMIDLLVDFQRGKMFGYQNNAELLFGGLQLMYGMDKGANDTFKRLLSSGDVPQNLRDRAFFFLGRSLYQKGYFSEADEMLAKADLPASSALGAELRLIRANIALSLDDPSNAHRLLDDWQEMPDRWRLIARYDQGVAYLRGGDEASGILALEDVATAPPYHDVAFSLRDKANSVLGYYKLYTSDLQAAQQYLDEVRLEGPFSNEALLSIGWAYAEAGDYESALVPWSELGRRASSDVWVQESLLAVAYAYSKMKAYSQSSDAYQRALDILRAEIDLISEAIDGAENGSILAAMLSNADAIDAGQVSETRLIESVVKRYLQDLVGNDRFQKPFKSLRYVVDVRDKLDQWEQSLSVLEGLVLQHQELELSTQRKLDEIFDRLDRARPNVSQSTDQELINEFSVVENRHFESLELVANSTVLSQAFLDRIGEERESIRLQKDNSFALGSEAQRSYRRLACRSFGKAPRACFKL